MKRASFLFLVALGAVAATPDASDVNAVAAAGTGTEPAAGTQLRLGDNEKLGASTAISAKECRVYAHIRDNVVSKLEVRRIKGRCSFDELRHRDV